MKKKNFFQTMLIALFACVTLASCDEWVDDYNQAKALSGQWTGDFGMNYTYSYYGRNYIFDSYDTDVIFYPEYSGAMKGWGKQVDFYDQGPYEYIYNKFYWEIRNGIVYLDYPNDKSMSTSIYNYHMDNDFFTGTFDNTKETFKLRKIADYYDWTPYVNIYSTGGRDNWYDGYNRYNANTRSTTSDTLSAGTDSAEGHIVSFGNRFKKN